MVDMIWKYHRTTHAGHFIEPIANFHTWLAQHCAFGTDFILKGWFIRCLKAAYCKIHKLNFI